MVLAELPGLIAERLQHRGKRHGLIWHAYVGSGQTYSGQTGSDWQFAGDEIGATGCAARFRIVVGEAHALTGELVKVRCLAGHDALVIRANIKPADIIAHDDEYVGFLLLLCDCLRARHHCRSEQREPAGPSTPYAHDLVPFNLMRLV